MAKKTLPADASKEILATLKARFEKNTDRHKGIKWDDVEKKLLAASSKLWSVSEMEQTGGEPDVIGKDEETGEFLIVDCSAESPKDRRSLCYDLSAWESRKENKPKSSAMEMAKEMGVEILDEDQYRELQKLGNFDTKTSSWVLTPTDIRKKGGAIFCDWRYGHVFTYHNGAESYYAARGFRAMVRV